ncbi:hypothetical protein ABPG74_019060 [Tetrahymena malaccensis]
MSNLHIIRNLNNQEETLNGTQQKLFMFKFVKLQPSSNNQTCLQKIQKTWSQDGCYYIKESGYCYCNSTNPTTVTDDLKSLLINKNLQDALSSKGFNSITNFKYCYKYAIVWSLVFITLLQFKLFSYGKNLDKKSNKPTISQIMPELEPQQENPLDSGKNETPQLQLQSIQELNGVIMQQNKNSNQQILSSNKRKRKNLNVTQTNIKIEKKESEQIEILRLDNQSQSESYPNQIPENLKNYVNQQPQIQELDQPEQLKEQNQPQSQDENLNQNKFVNSNKFTVTTFQDQISTSNLVNLDIKLTQNELMCIQKFKQLTLFVQFKVLHTFFNTIYTYDPDLSRPIRFNLFYLRIIHSLCLSTVFDENYNISQQIIISIVSSIIIVAGVFLVTLVHKVRRIGQKLSAFLMVCLLVFYYYVILAVVSSEEASYANSKYFSFFLIIGVDIVAEELEQNFYKHPVHIHGKVVLYGDVMIDVSIIQLSNQNNIKRQPIVNCCFADNEGSNYQIALHYDPEALLKKCQELVLKNLDLKGQIYAFNLYTFDTDKMRLYRYLATNDAKL